MQLLALFVLCVYSRNSVFERINDLPTVQNTGFAPDSAIANIRKAISETSDEAKIKDVAGKLGIAGDNANDLKAQISQVLSSDKYNKEIWNSFADDTTKANLDYIKYVDKISSDYGANVESYKTDLKKLIIAADKDAKVADMTLGDLEKLAKIKNKEAFSQYKIAFESNLIKLGRDYKALFKINAVDQLDHYPKLKAALGVTDEFANLSPEEKLGIYSGLKAVDPKVLPKDAQSELSAFTKQVNKLKNAENEFFSKAAKEGDAAAAVLSKTIQNARISKGTIAGIAIGSAAAGGTAMWLASGSKDSKPVLLPNGQPVASIASQKQ